ncbi:MAG: hypothetical protein ABI840_04655, partial [bacterium]
PVQASANLYFSSAQNGVFGFGKGYLDDLTLKSRIFFQSGKRYTEQILTGYLPSGRPEYKSNIDDINGKVGQNWFWVDLDLERNINLQSMEIVVGIYVTNLFNTLNAAIINPVTGEAYEYGQPTPNFVNDPLYPDLQAPITPYPFNPARFLTPRNIKFGISLKL